MLLFLIIILFCHNAKANDVQFGEYRYSQYLGIQQQLQNQRVNAIRRQRMYNQSPTRNIRYPSANNPYPNIQRNNNVRLTPQQRYSAQYYRSL